MKRFLSGFAAAVLLLQSVATSLVYAQDVNDNVEFDSTPAVETTVVDQASDDSIGGDDNLSEETPTLDVADAIDASEEESEEDVDEISEELEEANDVEPEVLEEVTESEDTEAIEEDTNEEPVIEEAEDVVPKEDVEDENIVAEEISEEVAVEEPVVTSGSSENNEETNVEEEVKEEVINEVEDEIVEEVSEPTYGQSIYQQPEEVLYRAVTGGVIVVAVDSLGAFPKGTEMVVTPVESDEVFDLVNDATNYNVTKVTAVDITFYNEGEEIEPTKPISVTIRTQEMAAPQAVVHIDDDNNVEEIDSDINAKTVKFEAGGFSIYAIVQGEDTRTKVTFYNGNKEITSIYVKDGDNLNDLIFDPGIGESEGKVFKGWTTNPEYTVESIDTEEALTIEGVRTYVSENLSESELSIYAMMFDRYIVKYFEPYGKVVIDTEEIPVKCDATPCSVDYYVNHGYNTENPDENLLGWKIDGEGESILYTGISLSGDLNLWADVKPGHWLIFNENGRGATYNAPRFIETNAVTTSEGLLDMVRFGYTFDNWYEAEELDLSGNLISLKDTPFEFGNKLTDNTTIYANWLSGETANYTVLIWKQKVDGEGYDFEESISLNGTVGATVNTITQQGEGNNAFAKIDGVDKQYVGFHFKEFDQNVKIKTEGNSVVNVYYDRNEYTLTFQINDYIYTTTTSNSNTQYGLVNGQYVELTRHRRNNNYYWTYGDSYLSEGTRYTGTRYTRSDRKSLQTIQTIVALYGQNIRSNFPIVGTNGINYTGASWSSNGSSIFNDEAYVSYIDTMQAESTTFRLADNPTSNYFTYHVKYYVEALPTDTDTATYEGKEFILYQDAEIHSTYSDLYSTESEEFTDITGFGKYGSNPAYSNGTGNFDNNRTISLYYTRNVYPINFMDGRYVDGNGNELEDHHTEQLSLIPDIVYGADLTSYNKGGSNYQDPTNNYGYVFEGWYIDDKCTQPYTFTTMPEGGLTVYAKWRQIQYRVFLHPNAGTDPSLDWGTENQQMNFRISYGGKVSAPTGTRTGYIFGGWYRDEGLTQRFNAEAYVLNEENVTAAYDKTKDFTDPMDKWGNGATSNSDITGFSGSNRFRITKKLDLYAKWSKIIPGASGINLIYDLDGGSLSNAKDNKLLYSDNSDASVLSAPTKQGYQFINWVVQKWNGSEFVDTEVSVLPGQSFKVYLDNAKRVEESDSTTENPKYTYTIQIRANYIPEKTPETTKIVYCDNYEGGGCTEAEVKVVNAEFEIAAAPARVGYTFKEWNTDQSGENGTGFNPLQKVAADNIGLDADEPNTLYAIWVRDDSQTHKASYVINYYRGTEKVGADELSGYATGWILDPVTVNVAYQVEENKYEGYVLDRTNSDTPAATVSTDGTGDKVVEYNIRYVIKTFSVTFNSDGGSAVTGQTVEYNKVATKPADPTKAGYNFKGWTLEGKTFDFSTPITSDIELVAQWSKAGGGGGGSGGGKTPDDCPNGDKSGDRYDGTCDAPGGGDDEEEIELGGQVSDKCSISGTNLSAEEVAAYLYACENDITTIRDINEARMGDFLNRAEMAKIISVFATKELGMKPNTSKDCSNFTESMEGWSQEMKDYMVMSCQLELMGIHTVNYEAIPDFMPAKRVSRAEFGTILSRVLWGDTYEGTNENYYFRHLDALKANGIITNIDPNITEYRAWVFLMIYRSVEAIKSNRGISSSESIEEQVDEELNNEGSTIGMPNPAAVYCEERGGVVNLDTGKCKLPDGSEVDQWEYFRANNPDAETTTD